MLHDVFHADEPEYEEEEEEESGEERSVEIEVNQPGDTEKTSLEPEMLLDFVPSPNYDEEEVEEEPEEIVQNQSVRNRPRPNQQQPQQQQQQPQQRSEQDQQQFETHVERELADFQCLTCVASNVTQCEQEGSYETCFVGQTCHFELREKNGEVIQVKKGCKQEHSCHDQRKQNFTQNSNRNHQQCRPGQKRGPSVCRKCCSENGCTEGFDVSIRANWFHNWN